MSVLANFREAAFGIFRSRFLRQSGWMTASAVASLVLGMLFNIGFTWSAGVAALGLLTLTQGVVEFVSMLLDLRVDEALTRAIIFHRREGRPGRALSAIGVAYAVDFLLGVLVLALLLFVLAPLLPRVGAYFHLEAGYRDPALASLVRIYALGFFFSTVNSSGIGVLQAFQAFRTIGVLFFLSAVLECLVPLAAWWYWGTLDAVVWAMAANFLLYGTGLGLLTWRLMRREFAGVRPEAPREVARELLRFGGVITVSGGLKTAFRYLNVLVLGAWAAEIQGYYRIAMTYGNAIGFFAGPVGSVLLPKQTANAAAGDWKRFREVNRRLMLGMAAFSVPVGILMVLVAPWLLPLVWKGGAPAVAAVPWIVMTAVLTNLSCYLRPSIVAVGRPGISVWTNLLMLPCLAVFTTLLAPAGRHVGVAQAWFLTHLLGVGAGMWLLRKAMRERQE